MGRRRYRSRGTIESQAARDTTRTANRSGPIGALGIGLFGFVLFYWIFPHWVQGSIDAQAPGIHRQLVEAAISPRIHLMERTGLVCLIAGSSVAAYKALMQERLTHNGETALGFLSRFVARIFD